MSGEQMVEGDKADPRRVVLLVEDNPGDAELVRDFLDDKNAVAYEVLHAPSMHQAVELLRRQPVDAVVLDLRLPDADGVDSVRTLRKVAGELPLVVLTGNEDDGLAFACLDAGAQDYLIKNEINAVSLRRSIEYSISRLRERQLHELFSRQLDEIVSTSPATLYLVGIEGRTFRHNWVSDNFERLTGYAPADVGQDWWLDNLHPEDRDWVVEQGEKIFELGTLKREYRIRRRDGSWLWIRDEQRLVSDAQGVPVRVVGSWFDISDRRAAERKLAESEERYRMLFEDNPHPMWVFDPESLVFLVVNDAALRLFGFSREEMLGKSLGDFYPAEGRGSSVGLPGLRRWQSKDGSLVELEVQIQPVQHGGRPARLVVGTDLREQRRLELQLLQSQKMEAIGQLAGGVAHDFNNLLGVIMGYCELLETELGPGSHAGQRLEHILKAAERAAGLTRQLLAFSRKQLMQPKVLDLGVVVAGVSQMLRRLIGEDVELVVEARDRPTTVFADPGQLEQVILNLAVNARDAMPDGGRLLIETGRIEIDPAAAWRKPGFEPGSYVLLAVTDSGCGIAPQVAAQIFEPFFTTKEAGKGTGLGLSTVYGIVKQSGGYISVDSEPGEGTTFKIYLPRGENEVELAEPPPPPPTRRGTETILLLEDSEPLRLILHEMLEAAGYSVLDGDTVEEALQRVTAHDLPVDLVLSDVIMPGASGPEVVARLRATQPHVRAIFMSGYSDEAIGRHGILERGTHFLQKPFSSKALRHKVREVLDGKPWTGTPSGPSFDPGLPVC